MWSRAEPAFFVTPAYIAPATALRHLGGRRPPSQETVHHDDVHEAEAAMAESRGHAAHDLEAVPQPETDGHLVGGGDEVELHGLEAGGARDVEGMCTEGAG